MRDMPCLVVENGSQRSKRFDIPDGARLIIGRDPEAQIPLDDHLCSRRHCEVVRQGTAITLRDLGSSNGTYVNEVRITEVQLKPGDVVHAGETHMSFQGDAEETREASKGLVGKTVGGYRIIERLGRGAMGTVFKANQVSLDRVVALKILSPRLSSDPREVTRFTNEARAAAKLNHQNVVAVYETGSDQDLNFYSMEYIENGSVQDLATREGRLEPDLALDIILDAARGLEYAEKRGIVHRDIKPDNLMINAEGVVKIADMGLARDAGEMAHRAEQGGEEAIFGTPHFISPEQARGERVDTRSDIYSLGATLYRLLAGTTVFQGANVREIIQKQIEELPRPLRELQSDVPQALDELTLRMLKKDPAERPQTAAQLVQMLEAIQSGTKTKGRGGLIAAALVLLVVGGGAALWLLQPEPTPTPAPGPNNTTVIVDDTAARAADAAARAKLREAEARERLADLKLEDAQLKDEARDAVRLQALKARYEAFASTYAGTEAAAAVGNAISALDGELAAHSARAEAQAKAAAQRAEQAELRKNAALRTADECAVSGQQGIALTALEAALAAPEIAGSAHATLLRNKADTILATLQQECAGLRESAKIATDVGAAATNLEKRAALLKEGLGSLDALQPVRDLVKALEDDAASMREAFAKKSADDQQHDATLTNTTLRKATLALAEKFDLATPRHELESARAQLKTSAAAAAFNEVLDDLDALDRFKQVMVREFSSGLKNPPLRMPSERDPARLVTWNFLSADAKGFSARLGTAEPKVFAWSDQKPAVLLEHVFKPRLPESAELRRDGAVFAMRAGLPEEALALLGNDEDPKAQRLKSRATRETEAVRLLAEIRDLEKRAAENERLWVQILPRIEDFLKRFHDTIVGQMNTRGDGR
jgi:pSer/pThr/pTyr-binding forkhead associated (FHA) protein